MSKVFRTEIWLCATVYVRASNADEAAEILSEIDSTADFYTGQEISPGLEISGERLESEDLPNVSLSPSMTVYLSKINGSPSSLQPIDSDDFEIAHDPDETDDDGAESDADDFRAFCEGATPAQLDAIIEKEQSAGRNDMAAIARAVKGNR